MGMHVIIVSGGYDLPEVYGPYKTAEDAERAARARKPPEGSTFDVVPLADTKSFMDFDPRS